MPCLLAGLRSETVGIDVRVYAVSLFNHAKHYNNLYAFLKTTDIELFYAILVYITSKFTDNIGLLLFLSQLLTILPLYCVVLLNKQIKSKAFAMSIYFFLIYNLSFSIMRQCIAGAIVLFAYYLLEEKKYMYSLAFVLIAFLFHNSALGIVIVYMIINFLYKRNVKLLLFPAIIIFIAFFKEIFDVLVYNLHIIPVEYYVRTYSKINSNDISGADFIIRGLFTFTPIVIIVMSRFKNDYLKKYSFSSVVGYFLSLSAMISQYLIRLSYYFYFISIIFISSLATYISAKGNGKYLYYIIMLILLFAYWYIIYIAYGWHGTANYTFA